MIRPEFVKWKDATNRLLALPISNDDDHRDAMILSIEAILDEREQLQPFIQSPFSTEEVAFGKELVIQESKVAVKLESYLTAIRKDLSTSQTKKDSVRSYVNPYSKVARDGTFYDMKQ